MEKLNLEDAMSQSVRDAKQNEIPIVAHRKNRHEWLITMRAIDWFTIFREFEAGTDLKLRYQGWLANQEVKEREIVNAEGTD